MSTLRFVLGDQLTRALSSLADLDPAHDVVLMVEADAETRYVPHHPQKIALVLSAMRHFAADLRAEGITVDYVRLDDAANTGSFAGELARAVERVRPSRVVVTAPGEWRVLRILESFAAAPGVPLEIREDDRFFASRARFACWARGRRTLRMEHFYREMRRETGLLMQGRDPVGGRWNFDAENRRPLPAAASLPARRRFTPDAMTTEVLGLVRARYGHHFGTLERFGWPVTRAEALAALEEFIAGHLPQFGAYQDAMRTGEPFLHHAVISPALNLGLLTAREVCGRAVAAYERGAAPLNAVEGFVRQILGWREYVRGIYWLKMPEYRATNALDAQRPLPALYWTAQTPLRCLSEVVAQTRDYAYAHHIQRLMVTGNFALLAGVRPEDVEAWYLAVYADAFDWVELPNTHGMTLFADGGLLASKPYAASGAYIARMSDYCTHCAFDVKQKTGPRACPFNFLYWAFLLRNEKPLAGNPRLAMAYRTLDGWSVDRKAAVLAAAAEFLDGLS